MIYKFEEKGVTYAFTANSRIEAQAFASRYFQLDGPVRPSATFMKGLDAHRVRVIGRRDVRIVGWEA